MGCGVGKIIKNIFGGLFLSKDSPNPLNAIEDEVKEEVKKLLLENFNISFIDDKLEGEIYDSVIDGVFSIINQQLDNFIQKKDV